MALHSTYTRQIYGQLRYRGTWLPQSVLGLGDVGTLDRGIFVPETHLGRLGIQFEPVVEHGPDGSLDFQSKGAVSVAFKAAGAVDPHFRFLGEGEAGAAVDFVDQDAVALHLRGIRTERVADRAALRRQLLESVVIADDEQRWERDWLVVTDVVRADAATVLVSESARSHIELRANANVVPTSLADLSANLVLAGASDMSIKLVAERDRTPLYRALRVRRNFWWLYDEVVLASEEAPDAEATFGEADPADDLS